MTTNGDEYKTEFGEFLDLTSESHDLTPVNEEFNDFVSMNNIPLDKSPLYSQISELVSQIKAEKASK